MQECWVAVVDLEEIEGVTAEGCECPWGSRFGVVNEVEEDGEVLADCTVEVVGRGADSPG